MRVHYHRGLRPTCGIKTQNDVKVTSRPDRVSCRSCLKILRNIGQIAEGRLRAEGESTDG